VCCGLLSLIGGAVLLGATIGLIGVAAYKTFKYFSGKNSKETKSNPNSLAMYGYP